MRSTATAVLAVLASCSKPPCGTTSLAPSYQLAAPGIAVEVDTTHFMLHVRDDSGATVLETPIAGDGYAAATWTTGVVDAKEFPAPGYSSFQAVLDPWHTLEIVGVDQTSPDSAVLNLHDPALGDSACVTMTLSLRDHALRVEATTHAATPRAWSTGFASTPDEGFLGFGERYNRTNQRGVPLYNYVEEGGIGAGEGFPPSPDNPYPNGEAMTYYPVPFFISTHGYAFWLDTTWRSQFELATERDDAWRIWHVGPELAYEVYTTTADGSDTRPWPYHLIDRFTEATGRPMAAPEWSYGPRRRIGRTDMQGNVSEAQAMRDLDLAITSIDDAMHFYPNGKQLGAEADITAWTTSSHALGYHVNAYYNSMISRADDSPLKPRADEGAAAGYYLTRADGTFPDDWILTGGKVVNVFLVDFTNPDANRWYQQSFDWAMSLGYSGWMYDFGEYVSTDSVGANGMTGAELHSLYPVLYAKAAHDYMQASSLSNEWFAFMRSGYTGASQYMPAVWSGDPNASFDQADGLPSMVRAGINSGVSGIPNWGGDIGGYHCLRDGVTAANGELLARWIEQGALTPIMQDQDACVGGDATLKASIFNSSDAQDAWRTYARLHTRLVPYIYTLGLQAHATGEPIMRHVFLEHPDHPELASEDSAYYMGPALFVAPVITRGARTRTVTLPPGTFLEWQPTGASSTVLTGGASVTLDAPLGKLPLLLRAGYLVPLLDPTIDTLGEESSPDIVSAGDVADVYDVVGLLVAGQTASFTVHDGSALAAAWSGGFAPGTLLEVASESELATCTGCYQRTQLAPNLERVRVSASSGQVAAGGLTLTAATSRRIRWDLYLVTPN